MGRYYSRRNGNLYIYVTGEDPMIDLRLFPPELNLFESESAWRIHEKMAIVDEAQEDSLDRAEIILDLNGFRRIDLEEGALESYYALGDETALGVEAPPEVMGPPGPRMEPEPGPSFEGVIMPEVAIPEVSEPEVAEPTRPPPEVTSPRDGAAARGGADLDPNGAEDRR